MKKYKQAAISIAFLTIILTAGIYSGYASDNNKIPEDSREKEEMFLEAFENNDYDAWKKLIGKNKKIKKLVSQEEFNKFTQARILARSGKYDQAIKLSKELESRLKPNINYLYS